MSPGSRDKQLVTEARAIVGDLLAPKARIYWVDFLFHVSVGWGAFILALRSESFSLEQWLLGLVSAVALYRAVLFTHELAHLASSSFGLFRFVWNVLCGFPLMVPSFTYHGVHNDHHKRRIYGTRADGEYLPFGRERPPKILLYLLLIFVLGPLLAGRFLLLTPLSYLNKTLRRLVWERTSSLTIDPSYRRPPPSSRDGRHWRLQELVTFAYAGAAVTLVATGRLPAKVLALWYFVSVVIFLLNSLRTLAAHRYGNPGDRAMDFVEQYLDSVDVPGNALLTPLWAPVGLRYHATHHLLPGLPYHALGKAHRRLASELADPAFYLQTTRSGLWNALAMLWRDSTAFLAEKQPTHQAPAGG